MARDRYGGSIASRRARPARAASRSQVSHRNPRPAAGFQGALTLDAAEPDGFAAWLQGRADAPMRVQKPLRLSGNLDVAPDRVSLDAMSGEIDGSAIDGRLALLFPDNAPSRADIRLKADRLDLDFGRRSGAITRRAVCRLARPSADIARYRPRDLGWTGDAPFAMELHYGGADDALDRLRVGEATA